MCDYSLAGMSNRLAIEGEQLLIHQFPTGSLGLVSGRRRFREILFPSMMVAVCIPPWAHLVLHDIPDHLQLRLGVSSVEEVIFVQSTSDALTYRDSVRFGNGREVLLQQLRCDQRVIVLSLSDEDEIAFRSSKRADSFADQRSPLMAQTGR